MILIDTGSTRSFITEKIAFKYFKDKIHKETFTVKTSHGSSQGNYYVEFQDEKYFCDHPISLKLYVYDFHEKFQMLLGLDSLKTLGAKLNFLENTIITSSKTIPLQYLPINTKTIQIHPRCRQVIKVDIANLENGEGIIPYCKIGPIEIPQSLVSVKNFETFVAVLNNSEKPVRLIPLAPLAVEEFSLPETKIAPQESLNTLQNINNKEITVRTEHMNEEEKTEILKLVRKYSDVFHKEGEPLTFTNDVKHVIRTTDEIPTYSKLYRYPEVHKMEVRKQIQSMLSQNIIRPSFSPWSAPVWVVPKKMDASGKQKWRVVIDYRKLNEKTIDDRFPIPNITDILDKLGKSKYFSTIDLASGFYQVELHPDSIPKTAFTVEDGHYEFCRLPMGLKNSPRTFQRVMDNVLRGLTNEHCLVYLDDVIIFSSSLQEHIVSLEEVFKRFRNANLKIQLDKTEFLRKEVAYLGHIITPEGVKPNPDKIEAIMRYPIPKTTKEIKQFLGLLGYYRKFIPNFADLTKPFTNCLKRTGVINIYDPNYKQCFDTCRKILTNAPILQYPDFSKEFNLTTDASSVALGAVLSQNHGGKDLPVAYASRTLNDSEQNLSTIERELLAIVWATQYFRPYLYGKRFRIFSDHKPLQWIFSLKEPSGKLLRWRLKLEQYDYTINYKNGALNTNADALSRIQLNVNEVQKIDEIEDLRQACFREYDLASAPDSVAVNVDNEEGSANTEHSNAEGNDTATIPITDQPVNLAKRQIFISLVEQAPEPTKIITLHGTKKRLICQLSDNNFDEDLVNFVREYVTPGLRYYLYFENNIYERFVTAFMIYFKTSEIKFIKCTSKLVDVVDDSEKNEIIENYHLGKTNHRGITETTWKIKNIYYWPNLIQTITDYINKCEVCLKVKYERKPLNLKLNITPTPAKPFQTIHIDSITLDSTKFLTLIDSFSKFAQAYKLESSQGISVCNALIRFFSHYGIPQLIISDNGLEFNNSVVRDLLETHKIEIHFISSQHPESNGQIERFHSTLIEHIRLMKNQDQYNGDPIEIKVMYALIAYNNTIHTATKLTPFEIISGHLDLSSPFLVNMNHHILNNYIQAHKERTALLYEQINKISSNIKEKIVSRENETREDLPTVPSKVFVVNKQKQNKLGNKYKPEELTYINEGRKTGKIKKSHKNTRENIHLSNIKRPRKIYKILSVPGPSK